MAYHRTWPAGFAFWIAALIHVHYCTSEVNAAEAYADVNGGTCGVFQEDEHEGTSFATASISGNHAPSGATWSAGSSVVQSANNIHTVSISAFAFATPPPEITEATFLCHCGAQARSAFYDDLTITNTEALQQFPGGALVLTLPLYMDGQLDYDRSPSLNHARVRFSASMGSDAAGPIAGWPTYASYFFDSDVDPISPTGPKEVREHLSPAIAVDLAHPVVSFAMSFNVEVNAQPGTTITSLANFSQTGKTGPIIITDIYGNPIPGSEKLRIVGSSGIEYSIQVVPEPASSLVVAFAVVVAGFISRRARYNPPPRLCTFTPTCA